MVDLTDTEPVTLKQANKYIQNKFPGMSFTESGEDIRGETLDHLIVKNNPELSVYSIAEQWGSISEQYNTKSEFVVNMFNEVLSEEIISKLPESERDTLIQVHVGAIEEEL